MNHRMLAGVAALLIAGATALQAQIPPDTGRAKPDSVKKTITRTVTSAGDVLAADTTVEWYYPTGKTCASVDVSKSKAVTIKQDLYKPDAGMISPDSAKFLALCAVPGQIGSGEMNVDNGITEYAIDIIPNGKMTHTKVVIDANTGYVLSSKQFGGLRGLAGWVRESAEHKTNKVKPANDTTPKKPPI